MTRVIRACTWRRRASLQLVRGTRQATVGSLALPQVVPADHRFIERLCVRKLERA